MVVAPNAAEVAIVALGDVYVVSLLSFLTQRITDTPEAERDVSFPVMGIVCSTLLSVRAVGIFIKVM